LLKLRANKSAQQLQLGLGMKRYDSAWEPLVVTALFIFAVIGTWC
jgi:hypothetical protein